jgi:nucleotide-binding universal stress UspA family protein
MNPQKIVIAMPTEEDFMPSISRWGQEYGWTKREVYFIYVIRKDVCVGEMSVVETPSKAAQENMKQHLLEFIKNKASEMMPLPTFKQAHFEVQFAQSPADQLAEYAKEINAGMIVVATRNKRGFSRMFLSTFADRLLKLSHCDVLVLRPNSSPRSKPWGINCALIIRWLSASIRPKGREMLVPSSNVPSSNVPSSNVPSSNVPSSNVPSSNVYFLPNRNVHR